MIASNKNVEYSMSALILDDFFFLSEKEIKSVLDFLFKKVSFYILSIAFSFFNKNIK